MNLGADRKKLQWLAGLMVLAGGSMYYNLFSEPDIPASAKQARPQTPKAAPDVVTAPTDAQTQRRLEQRKQMVGGRQSVGEFRPTLKFTKDTQPDPMKVDPTLRLDLLAKLQNVTLQGGARSLFEIGTAPATPDVPKIEPGKPPPPKKGYLAKAMGPDPKPPDVKVAETPKAPPPPIPLKFYGFSSPKAGGTKRAFFLEGEDIHVASEGELIKRRYKVVKIGATSAVVEDTEHKHQQTLALEEPPANS